MWAECWGLQVDPRVPAAQRRFLAELFNAWTPPPFQAQPMAAVVLPWDSEADRHMHLAATAPVLPMPGPPGSPSMQAQALTAACWRLVCGSGRCILDLTPGEPARLRCDGPGAEGLLFAALTEAFRCAGWMTLHAAGYASVPGGVRLTLGRSGAGKSTRALTLGQGGAGFLAEDRAWLRAADLLLVPRDRRVRLLPDGRRWVPEDRRHLERTDPDGKLRYPLDALGLLPAPPARPDELEVLLGRLDADPLDIPPPERSARRRLLVTQAVWEALGLPLVPAARQATMQTAQALLALPSSLWWRDAQGRVCRCAE